MKKTLLTLAILLGFAQLATAQIVDHWKTLGECQAAVGAPYYRPEIINHRAPATNEIVRGSVGGCADMDLPDRLGGRGFVRVAPNEDLVFSPKTGEILRLARCNNHIYSFTPFAPPQGARGPEGPQGPAGPVGPAGPAGSPRESSPNFCCLGDILKQFEAMNRETEPVVVHAEKHEKKGFWSTKTGRAILIAAPAVGTGLIVYYNTRGKPPLAIAGIPQ